MLWSICFCPILETAFTIGFETKLQIFKHYSNEKKILYPHIDFEINNILKIDSNTDDNYINLHMKPFIVFRKKVFLKMYTF